MTKLALLVCISSLAPSWPAADSRHEQGSDPKAPVQSDSAPINYPTFEPFVASRMFKQFFADIDGLDLNKALEDLKKTREIQAHAKEVGAKYGPKPDPAAPSALLQPVLVPAVHDVYQLLPALMLRLAPLWSAKAWSKEQLETAATAARILEKIPDAPKLAFAEAADAKRHEELRKLVRWFVAEAARPERYAALIPTIDDGPYAGLSYEAKGVLPSTASQRLDDETEIRLCKVERPKEPWVLQAVRSEKVLWSRVLSASPDESVRDAELRSQPQRMGPYGWKVFLTVKWSQGLESCYLYLDAKGGFLFYYLTW